MEGRVGEAVGAGSLDRPVERLSQIVDELIHDSRVGLETLQVQPFVVGMHTAAARTPADGRSADGAVVTGVGGEVFGEQFRFFAQYFGAGGKGALQLWVGLIGEKRNSQLNQLQLAIVERLFQPVHDLVGIVLGNVADIYFALDHARNPVVRILAHVDAGGSSGGLPNRLSRYRESSSESVEAAHQGVQRVLAEPWAGRVARIAFESHLDP